jgi:hypothetical protein
MYYLELAVKPSSVAQVMGFTSGIKQASTIPLARDAYMHGNEATQLNH